jgi:hypothetical protein
MDWITNAFSLNMLRDPAGTRIDVRALTEDEARERARTARSAVGHADTARVIADRLGVPVATNRDTVVLDDGDVLLVAQLRGPRLPEGATTLPAGAQLVWLQVTVGRPAPPGEGRPPAPAEADTPEADASTAPPATADGAEEARPSTDGDGATAEGTTEASESPEPTADAPPDLALADPQNGSLGPAPVAAPLDRRPKAEVLREITKQTAWKNLHAAAQERAALLARFPDAAAKADAAAADGQAQAEALDRLQQLGQRPGPHSGPFREQAEAICRRWRFLRDRVQRIKEYHEAKKSNADRAIRAGRPTSDLRPTRDSRVLALTPAARWTVLVDETGENFTTVGATGREGRFVAVVLPEGTRLAPPPPGFHAAHADDPTLDRGLQRLLDDEVGVFGVSLRDLPPTPGERWVDGVLELVDWLLLLLPRPADGRMELDVRVEARGQHGPGQDWHLAVREILRRHATRDPLSVAGLQLQIRTFGKYQEPLLAYADLVAHTWSARSAPTQARLAASGLRDACLIAGGAAELRGLWSGFTRDRALHPDAWAKLLALPAARDPLTIAGALADRLQDRTRSMPELWHGYLAWTLAHLESKAIDLLHLHGQLHWLSACAPEGEALPLVARHTWARARLDEANHRGQVDSEADGELQALGEQLLDERAPMVCEGDLRRAVLATNRFDFGAATAALSRWVDVDPRIPGLQMWGRVQSSLGQHEAFEGRLRAAVTHFDAALDAFARLSDPRVAAGELQQTRTYRAIAWMDDPAAPDAEARSALEATLGPLDTAVTRLRASTAPADKYSLHLLLRWAIHRGDRALQAALVEGAERWATGSGHPWPLICLYRSCLVERAGRAALAQDLLGQGVSLAWADGEGPTVRLIGLVLATLLAAPHPRRAEASAELARLRGALPAAAARLDRVERELLAPGDPMAFLADTLPFNFR